MIRAIAFGLLMSVAGGVALARPGLARYEPDPPEGYLPGLSASTGRLCVKQCPADDLPCDPPAFKIADGRCNTMWR